MNWLQRLKARFARYTYQWTCLSLPAGAPLPIIENADTNRPTIKNLVDGTYIFRFNKIDRMGEIAWLDVPVRVDSFVSVTIKEEVDNFPSCGNINP